MIDEISRMEHVEHNTTIGSNVMNEDVEEGGCIFGGARGFMVGKWCRRGLEENKL